MAEQQLIDYIKKTRGAGQDDEQTKTLLYQNGWSKEEVSEALLAVGGNVQAGSVTQNPQKKEEPRQQSSQQKPQDVQNAWNEPKIKESYTRPASALGSPETTETALAGKPASEISEKTVRPQMTDMTGLKEKPKKSILPAILVSLVLLILVGGAAGAGWMLYTGAWSPSWSPFKLTSEKVLANMASNMADVKSFGSKSNFQVTIPDGSISVISSGNIDATNSANLKTNNDFTISFTQKGAKGANISAKFSAISIGNDYYIKVDSLVFPAELNIDITAIKGKWLKVTSDSLKSLLATTGTSDIGIFDQVSQQSSKPTYSVANLIGLAVFSSDLGDTTLEGIKTYHYAMKIDKAKIKSFVTQTFFTSTDPADKSFIAGISDAVANLVGDVNIETWIGKKDFMVYGLKIAKTLDFKEFTSKPGTTAVSITLTENMSYPKINPPITVPANVLDAKVALLPILKLQAIRSNLSQLGTTAMSIFAGNASYTSLCNHSLLNGYQAKYGTLLISLNNDITAQDAIKPACFAEKDNFCISTQLADKSWLCINKKGIVGKVKCATATTDCK